ncbi:hypothetical protein SAMN05444422_108224 [Halobiforma haloterrestris]|uniref:Uncharacterized protein n=1 Tax=Natronobacterium haloterrestre TaxID=148448 RepID=A0A1I1JI05_NATHA|nr:hypothetical protein [Halobiforma haloterrestris]SFC45573.1 hypothetical protein SAMN05444422_108224 [Halobiforma haloterrestris]
MGRRNRSSGSGSGSRPNRNTGDPAARRRLAAGFVLLVGLSGSMMALQGGASLPMVGLVTAAGLLVGGALVWYLSWIVN